MADEKNNTGYRNTGYRNTGDRNTGDRNTGYRNTGYLNTGNCNTGNRNTGDWNTGYRNTGYLNTGYGVVTFFGKPCPNLSWDDAEELIPYCELPVGCEWVETNDMTDEEKKSAPSHVTTGGFLRVLSNSIQDAFPLVWAKADIEWKRRWINLPHFDADMFVILVGVDVRLDKDLYPQPVTPVIVDPVPEKVVINGRIYVLAATMGGEGGG